MADTQTAATTDTAAKGDTATTNQAASTAADSTTTTTDPTSGKGGDTATQAKRAPDTYALSIPKDGERFITQQDLEFFERAARTNDWTQDEAQAEVTAHAERATTRFAAILATAEAEAKGHEVYGGAQYDETRRLAQQGIDVIFPPGHLMRDRFLSEWQHSGYQVTLPLLAAFAEIGKRSREDSPGRTTTATTPESEEKALRGFYDHPTSQRLQDEARA